MKATIKPRINLEGRTKLETVIPLSTPFIVFVDPSSVCNLRCKFCPTGDLELMKSVDRWQGVMDFDMYKRIIDSLDEFDRPIKVLRLYKDGEPLLNPKFPEMIAYAKKSKSVEYIDTTTNAVYLTPTVALSILDAGIDRINISVNGISDQQFVDFAGGGVNFEDYVQNIKFLYKNKGNCEICIKAAEDLIGEAGKQKFFDIFGDICDRIFIENFAPCWPEFDVEDRTGVEISEGIYKNELGDVQICPYIFYSTSINACGTVSLCFLDWSRKLVVGDIKDNTLKEIWNGDKLFEHRVANLYCNRKDNPVCADCGQLSHCMPDNIDPYKEMLLKKIEKKND